MRRRPYTHRSRHSQAGVNAFQLAPLARAKWMKELPMPPRS